MPTFTCVHVTGLFHFFRGIFIFFCILFFALSMANLFMPILYCNFFFLFFFLFKNIVSSILLHTHFDFVCCFMFFLLLNFFCSGFRLAFCCCKYADYFFDQIKSFAFTCASVDCLAAKLYYFIYFYVFMMCRNSIESTCR